MRTRAELTYFRYNFVGQSLGRSSVLGLDRLPLPVSTSHVSGLDEAT